MNSLRHLSLGVTRHGFGHVGRNLFSPGRRNRRLTRGGFWRTLLATEQPLQQTGATRLGRMLKLRQCLALQATELAEQQRDFPRLADTPFKLLGEVLQRSSDFTGQRQGLQLGHQGGQRGAHLFGTGLATLFGVEHGLFQTRQQGRQGRVHIVAADDIAHFLHAQVNRAVGPFRRQGAAYQPTAKQVQTGVPATLELFLLFDAFKVFLFPAFDFFAAHAGVREI